MIKERATIFVHACQCEEGKSEKERIAAAFPREREVERLDWSHPIIWRKF
jgi:hypothetical protein